MYCPITINNSRRTNCVWSPKAQTKSVLKWPNFRVERNHFWSTPRINVRASFISDLHIWSTWWHKFIMQNICWWYFPFFKSSQYEKICELNKCWLRKKLANGSINGKCSLTLILINKQMRLFYLVNLIQQSFSIH